MGKWLFREHRGGLKESMKTCKSYNSLQEVIEAAVKKAVYEKRTDCISITLYSKEDERIGWSPVYIVCGRNEVIGFCTERDKS